MDVHNYIFNTHTFLFFTLKMLLGIIVFSGRTVLKSLLLSVYRSSTSEGKCKCYIIQTVFSESFFRKHYMFVKM